MQIKLANYKRELQKSKATLASLLGLPPLTDFSIADVDLKPIEVDIWDIKKLEDEALVSRPELFIQDSNEAIASDDVRSAFVRMFPNVNFFSGFDNDQNPLLRNSNWFNAGLRMSWNFLNIPKSMFEKKSAKAKEAAVRDTRMQLSIGIMTAVNIAYLDLHDAVSQHQLAVDLASVKGRMLAAGKKGQKQGEFDDADILGLEAESLFADIYKATTYAEVKVALERLANTVGLPMLFGDVRLPAYMYTDDDTSNVRTYQKLYISDAAQEGGDSPFPCNGNYKKPKGKNWNASASDWEVDASKNVPESVKRDSGKNWGVSCTPLSESCKSAGDTDLDSSPGVFDSGPGH